MIRMKSHDAERRAEGMQPQIRPARTTAEQASA
jgi:hypothetical protein